jgi:hypothetical protein
VESAAVSDDGRVAYVWRVGAGLELAHIDEVDLATGAARPWRELGPVEHATVVSSHPVIGPGARAPVTPGGLSRRHGREHALAALGGRAMLASGGCGSVTRWCCSLS